MHSCLNTRTFSGLTADLYDDISTGETKAGQSAQVLASLAKILRPTWAIEQNTIQTLNYTYLDF